MLFKWEKRGVARSGKKFFSGGLMNTVYEPVYECFREPISEREPEKKNLGNKGRPSCTYCKIYICNICIKK